MDLRCSSSLRIVSTSSLKPRRASLAAVSSSSVRSNLESSIVNPMLFVVKSRALSKACALKKFTEQMYPKTPTFHSAFVGYLRLK